MNAPLATDADATLEPVVAPSPVGSGSLRITQLRGPPGLRLEGDLDYTNRPALTLALGSLTDEDDICLELEGVTFIDVGSLRALVITAERLGDGRVLTMRAAPPQMRRLLQLTGWHNTPCMRFQSAIPALHIVPGLLTAQGSSQTSAAGGRSWLPQDALDDGGSSGTAG